MINSVIIALSTSSDSGSVARERRLLCGLCPPFTTVESSRRQRINTTSSLHGMAELPLKVGKTLSTGLNLVKFKEVN